MEGHLLGDEAASRWPRFAVLGQVCSCSLVRQHFVSLAFLSRRLPFNAPSRCICLAYRGSSSVVCFRLLHHYCFPTCLAALITWYVSSVE